MPYMRDVNKIGISAAKCGLAPFYWLGQTVHHRSGSICVWQHLVHLPSRSKQSWWSLCWCDVCITASNRWIIGRCEQDDILTHYAGNCLVLLFGFRNASLIIVYCFNVLYHRPHIFFNFLVCVPNWWNEKALWTNSILIYNACY